MKKFLALALALVMCLGIFAGCNNGGGDNSTPSGSNGDNSQPLAGTYEIKVWAPEAAVDHTKAQIEKFNNTNTDGIKIVAEVENVGEGDAATQMTTDIEAGADIFFFAEDQAARLIQAGALAQLGEAAAQLVKDTSDEESIAAATSGNSVWAYPLTSDNGYFMYYDKSVISEDDIDSLEKLIAACEAAGKMFSFEVEGSAWYTASFFFGAGCTSEWVTDDDGNFISVNDTFNSTKGLAAAKAMNALMNSTSYNNSSSTEAFDAAVPSAVVISGTWGYNTAKEILGDNLGTADLPSFTVDGNTYHLGSFKGCKLLGVKPQVDGKRGAALHKLAQYLTSEEVQLDRFNALGWGPSNVNAAADEAVLADAAQNAVKAQDTYATVQGQIHGSWWDIGKALAAGVKAATDDTGLQAALDAYTTTMQGLFEMTSEEKEAWAVIGTVNGTNWDADLPMTKQEDGTWKTDEAYEMTTSTEFKVRQGKSWDVNYGADGALNGANIKPEADGTYYVVFDPTTGIVSLVPAD